MQDFSSGRFTQYTRWSVEPGQERRWFLAAWMGIWMCVGTSITWQAGAKLFVEPNVVNGTRLLVQVVYSLMYGSIMLLILFKFRLYAKYKTLWDLLHLHYCQLTHIVNALYPLSGRIPPQDCMFACTLLAINPAFFGIPPWTYFHLMAACLPSHLFMHACSWAHLHGSDSLGGTQYLLSAAWLACVSSIVSYVGVVFFCPQDQLIAHNDSTKQGLPLPTRLWQCLLRMAHNHQVAARHWMSRHVNKNNSEALLLPLSVLYLVYSTWSVAVDWFTGHTALEVHPVQVVLLILTGYYSGSAHVLTSVNPKLQSALELLHDLIPAHIAHALLNVDDRQKEAHTSSVVARHAKGPGGSSAQFLSLSGDTTAYNSSRASQSGGQQPSLPLGQAGPSLLVTQKQDHQQQHVQQPSVSQSQQAGLLLAASSTDGNAAGNSAGQQGAALQGTQTSLGQQPVPDLPEGEHGSAPLVDGRSSSGSVALGRLMSAIRQAPHTIAGIVAGSAGQVPGTPDDDSRPSQQRVGEAESHKGVVNQGQGLVPHLGEATCAEWHESVTLLFCDIVGFTDCCKCVAPTEVMDMLNQLYWRYDGLCMGEGSKVYKVETIGDCYVAATGLLHNDPDHAVTMLEFARAIVREAAQVLMPHNNQPVRIRIGLHSGRVMTGVVGRIRKRYCCFGDTINTASRMESNSLPGRIHVSQATYDLIAASTAGHQYHWECRGQLDIKGKGLMTTYFLLEDEGQKPSTGSSSSQHVLH